MTCRCHLVPRWLLVALAVLAAPTLAAQQPASPAKHHASKVWHAIGSLALEEESNNNVFQLSDAAKVGLDTLTAAAPPTTRFADMQRANDYITVARVDLGVEGPGLLGRPLSVRADGRYDFYALNARRRNAELGFAIAQAFPHHGRLQLRGRFVPSYFYRNFMADAVDSNGDGSIESNERIYAAGTYSDARVLLGYRQWLIRSTATEPLGAAVELEVGRVTRTYAAPLSYRSYRGPEFVGGLTLDFTRSLGLDVGYTHAALRSTPDSAVLVVNEPDFNRDFNGDGTAVDLRVRTVQLVDFSRLEQQLLLGLRAELAPGLALGVHYQHRWRSFPSSQPYDVYNNSRRDRRDWAAVELSARLRPQVQFTVGADVETQKVTRSLVPSLTGEITDYTRTRVYAGWRYHL
ncbi:MAG TPA: hypothetical protein VM736_06715 [Gemmatimonadales bacterium]|nr:hypothetical protein [Gemmatimonadales bacterium]